MKTAKIKQPAVEIVKLKVSFCGICVTYGNSNFADIKIKKITTQKLLSSQMVRVEG